VPSLPPLRLSDDRRYLTQGGKPFFFFADTAWSIVFKGSPEQWATYLDRRAAQGFSVIQVTLLPWRWEWTDADGNRAFHDGDPDRPNEAYFARYDRFLEMAAERGLYTCLMVIWGGPRPLLPAVHFTTEQAVAFARWAVERFTKYPMLWSASGDAPYVEEIEKWEAVGAAIEAADPNDHPTTNHLPPIMNWRFLHHASRWHDFHMIQTGHRRNSVADITALPLAYYRREPVKAFVNGEPWYENHPSREVREIYGPTFTAEESRYAFWVSVLSGATMGHTYGAQGIWNWKRPGDDETEIAGPQIGPPWFEGLEYRGAEHCGIGARALRELPWWQLVPSPERVALDATPPGVLPDPASGLPAPSTLRAPACAHVPARLYVAYLPSGAGLGQLVLKGIEEAPWRARWLDPRTGASHLIGAVTLDQTHVWRAPTAPSAEDWVLILEA
jgi:hypothetical protein